MDYVYIIQSKQDNKSIYIGFTDDLRRRFSRHNLGQVQSTKSKRPWELVYYEAYKSKKDALIREKKLKLYAKGFAQLKRRIQNSLNEG